jgi:hypothetical protein
VGEEPEPESCGQLAGHEYEDAVLASWLSKEIS